MSEKRTIDLVECIDKILKDYRKDLVTDDLFDTDQVRIRRRGTGKDDFKPDDIVGVYLDTDFDEGKITETTIRTDIQRWLQKHGNKV